MKEFLHLIEHVVLVASLIANAGLFGVYVYPNLKKKS